MSPRHARLISECYQSFKKYVTLHSEVFFCSEYLLVFRGATELTRYVLLSVVNTEGFTISHNSLITSMYDESVQLPR